MNIVSGDGLVLVIAGTTLDQITDAYMSHWVNFRRASPMNKARNTPRVESSTAPNLKNVKQSSQVWNSLPENVLKCSLFHSGPIVKISWKSVHAFVRNFVHKQTDKPT